MNDFRIPLRGEGWRHHKGTLYEVVGVAIHTETGKPVVVYKPYSWTLAQDPPLYVRPLGVFLQSLDTPDGHRPRFSFERSPLRPAGEVR